MSTSIGRVARIGALGIGLLVLCFVGLVFAAHGAANMCDGHAMERLEQLDADGWSVNQRFSAWPPGMRCDFQFEQDGRVVSDESRVAPWQM